jgi:transcriptional regulator with XRE-family HTH domain
MEESSKFSNYIRERRMELGLFPEDVARMLGLKRAEPIRMVEAGERRPPLNRIPDLADALCLDRTELCRMFLKETAPKFSESLFAHSEMAPPASAIFEDRPEPGKLMLSVIMFPHTGESILGEILP